MLNRRKNLHAILPITSTSYLLSLKCLLSSLKYRTCHSVQFCSLVIFQVERTKLVCNIYFVSFRTKYNYHQIYVSDIITEVIRLNSHLHLNVYFYPKSKFILTIVSYVRYSPVFNCHFSLSFDCLVKTDLSVYLSHM